MTVLISSLVVALLPCQAWSTGHWEITDADGNTTPRSITDSYDNPPFAGQWVSITDSCTQPLEDAIGSSSFSSGSESEIYAVLEGEKSTTSSPYSGNIGLRNWTDCSGWYFFTWEDNPPSTSPGVVLSWSASGGGSVEMVVYADISGNTTVYTNADGDHSFEGYANGYYYDHEWPRGGAYTCGYVNMNPSTTSVYGSSSWWYNPEGYGDGDGYSPGGDSWSTHEGYIVGVQTDAWWSLDSVGDSYTSDPGVATVRMDSVSDSEAFVSVSLSVGTSSYGWGAGAGYAEGEYSFGASASTP